MTNSEALARASAYIGRLEEALAEYALRFGLTERARALFNEGPFTPLGELEADAHERA